MTSSYAAMRGSINYATIRISIPIIPVNRKTSITTIEIVRPAIGLCWTFAKCITNIFPTLNI